MTATSEMERFPVSVSDRIRMLDYRLNRGAQPVLTPKEAQARYGGTERK